MDTRTHVQPSSSDVVWSGPAVGLLDLDAFFASVEQLDHPEWRGKPVIVGGDAESRGVVSTASYEARRFGVHSAMPSAQAKRLCPDAIWTHGRYQRYREMSNKVMEILVDETPYVEQVSIDEAFFDVTPGTWSNEDPVQISRRVAERVSKLGVTCSIGLGTSKTVAKIASERNKPNGITVVYPGDEAAFLAPLPVDVMSGIGPSTKSRLMQMGIQTLGQLGVAQEEDLRIALGSVGPTLKLRALGAEESHVRRIDQHEAPKSISSERTFAQDLLDPAEVFSALQYVSSLTARRLRAKNLRGSCVTVKVLFSYSNGKTARENLEAPSDDERVIAAAARTAISRVWHEGTPVRLLGVGVSDFGERATQPTLFDDPCAEERDRERRALDQTTDELRRRFGTKAAMFGSELRVGFDAPSPDRDAT